jgi:hypothetical protein
MDSVLSPRFFTKEPDQKTIKISFRSKSSEKVKTEKSASIAMKSLRKYKKTVNLPHINLSPELPCDRSSGDLTGMNYSGHGNSKINKYFNRNALRFSKCFIQPMPYLQVLHCSYMLSDNRKQKNRSNQKLVPIRKV